MKLHIPNTITLINLFCGCSALVSIFSGNEWMLVLFVFLGAIADVADGLIARALGVSSELGKELDSISDMVTFGIVPGAMLYSLLLYSYSPETLQGGTSLVYAALPMFILSVFSGLRLAKFNIDTRQSVDFIGLPTPASTLLVLGVWISFHTNSFGLSDFLSNPYFLYALCGILSFLLIVEIPLIGNKFQGFTWRGNEWRYILISGCVLLTVLFQWFALVLIIPLYVALSIVRNLANKKELT